MVGGLLETCDDVSTVTEESEIPEKVEEELSGRQRTSLQNISPEKEKYLIKLRIP